MLLPFHIQVLLLIVVHADAVVGLNWDSALYQKLFSSGYNKRMRPLIDSTKPITVGIEFELKSISDLDETSEVFSTIGYIIVDWVDELLTWDPADYGGVKNLILPPEEVWLPDIGVANSAKNFYQRTFFLDFRVDVHYSGRVVWKYGGMFDTFCKLDMTYYPYDRQMCKIEIENWSYHRNHVNLFSEDNHVERGQFLENGKWSLDNTTARLSYYSADSHPGELFPRVTFTFYLSRKPLYYIFNIAMPCLLCTVVALTVFWLPPESGEKVSLGITVLLSISVFQLVVADNTPQTSESLPMLSLLMMTIMALAAISILTSILVLNLYHRTPISYPPNWAQNIAFKFLARVLCMKEFVPKIDSLKNDAHVISINKPEKDPAKNGSLKDNGPVISVKTPVNEVEKNDQLQYLVDHTKQKEEEENVRGAWRALAIIVDRLFFWLVLLVSLIVLPYFLARRDLEYEN